MYTYIKCMLNLRNDIPLKENVIDRVQQELAIIRDHSLAIEELVRFATQEKVYLTRQEVAELLRCDTKHIPRQIPNVRVSKNWVYDRDDVYKFLETRKRTRKY